MKLSNVKRRQILRIFTARTLVVSFLILVIMSATGTVFILKTKEIVYDETSQTPIQNSPVITTAPFPIGVDPINKIITENDITEIYLKDHLTSNRSRPGKQNWSSRLIAKFAQLNWYQNLASPISRILVILSGERKEEIVGHFGDILRWSNEERELFATLISDTAPKISDGKFFPEKYVVNKDISPEDLAAILQERFETEVLDRYSPEIQRIVPLEDTLIIASLLEREAYDFEDMREISGVIWNRLFIGMNLQIDASLQYAKGSNSNQPWWPKVVPDDKYIDSPFNTYKYKGLPPAPIGNPSLESILAALNPKKTECIFYFHDSDGMFHCTKTYEEHVKLLKEYYGQGR